MTETGKRSTAGAKLAEAVGRGITADRPGRRALMGSVALHAIVAVVLLVGGFALVPEPVEFETYRVSLVSPPPVAAGDPTPVQPPVDEEEPEEVQSDPEPEPDPPPEREPEPEPEPQPETIPQQEPEPVREEEPEPEPETEPPAEQLEQSQAEPPPPETQEESEPVDAAESAEKPATGTEPDPESERGGENLNVSIEGADFPFPGYLENIIRQINRYFRWRGQDGLEAEVYFVIYRDGSVSDIRLLDGSPDLSFNFAAMAAIEQAGKNGAFGPLPADFGADALPISFYFRPAQ